MVEDRIREKKWMKWMKWGEQMGCHQKPERSFFIEEYQMPVCARCTGVFLGYGVTLLTLPFLKNNKIRKEIALFGSTVMLLDWSLQALKIKESTNSRRLATGILGGMGLMNVWILFIKKIILKCKER